MNSLLATYNESDRTAYMKVVAYLAAVDGQMSSEEVFLLRELCLRYVLGPDARGEVMAATVMDHAELDATLQKLAATDLKYSLLLDMSTVAYADGVILEVEDRELRYAANALKVEDGALDAILELARRLHLAGTPTGSVLTGNLDDALAGLEKCGVPRSALGFSEFLRSATVA